MGATTDGRIPVLTNPYDIARVLESRLGMASAEVERITPQGNGTHIWFRRPEEQKAKFLYVFTNEGPLGPELFLTLQGTNAEAHRVMRGVVEVFGGFFCPDSTENKWEPITGLLNPDNNLFFAYRKAVVTGDFTQFESRLSEHEKERVFPKTPEPPLFG